MNNSYKAKQIKELTISMNLSNINILLIRKNFNFSTDKQVFENLAPVSSTGVDVCLLKKERR